MMFSGGVDSTLAAVRLLETFDRVHLLTWDTGRGAYFHGWSRRSAARLSEAYPGRVLQVIDSCAPLFDAIIRGRLTRLLRTYRSRFVWCLSCKLAMHAATVRFCRHNGIGDAGDGAASDTPYYVEQMACSLDWFRDFYSDHGVHYHLPVRDLDSREEKLRMLDELDLPKGKTLFGRNPGTQPLCLVGNGVYALSTFAGIHPNFDPGAVIAFLDDHRELASRLVEAGPEGVAAR